MLSETRPKKPNVNMHGLSQNNVPTKGGSLAGYNEPNLLQGGGAKNSKAGLAMVKSNPTKGEAPNQSVVDSLMQLLTD